MGGAFKGDDVHSNFLILETDGNGWGDGTNRPMSERKEDKSSFTPSSLLSGQVDWVIFVSVMILGDDGKDIGTYFTFIRDKVLS